MLLGRNRDADLEPGVWNARIVHAVKSISEVLGHDDCAVNGKLEIGQR